MSGVLNVVIVEVELLLELLGMCLALYGPRAARQVERLAEEFRVNLLRPAPLRTGTLVDPSPLTMAVLHGGI